MNDLGMVIRLLEYSDWANDRVLEAAAGLGDEQLDRGLEIGPGAGSLRRVLTHLWAGEGMWLRRWRGETEAKWPNESECLPIAMLRERLEAVRREREEFVRGLDATALGREQAYRDSRGGLFHATLGDMLTQGIVHSIHHRAQAVNAIRRLGGSAPELDYMMRSRRPA